MALLRYKPQGRSIPVHGFTLIEMLVVMSITMVLIAILLPVLGTARETARRVICATQLKQWGYVYTGYQLDFKDFFGGVVVCKEMRFLFTGTNLNYPPDNRPPWGGGTWYEESPFNRSTWEIGARGLNGTLVKSNNIQRCPSRKVSGYTEIVPTPDYGSGLDRPNSLTLTDYVVFCGFGNDITATINSVTGEYIKETATDTSPCWGNDYGNFPSTSTGPFTPPKARYPMAHMRQKRSMRTVLVMDRHFAANTSGVTHYGYQDIGDISNHGSKRPIFSSPAEGAANPAHFVEAAAGSNCLLLDQSVLWTVYGPNATDNTFYARDFYYRHAVGANLKNF